jgi:hypothetical protein
MHRTARSLFLLLAVVGAAVAQPAGPRPDPVLNEVDSEHSNVMF